MKRYLSLLIILAFAVILFSACDRKKADTPSKFQVCVSTYPIWLFTRSVMAGSGYEPVLIMPADAGCPHDYTLTPQDLRKVPTGGNALFLLNGGGLDAQIAETVHGIAPALQQVDTSAGIQAIAAADGDDDDDEHEAHEEHADDDDDDDDDDDGGEEHHHHHHHGDTNGHFFASPLAGVTIVGNIAAALSAKDPDHAELYRANAAALSGKLTALIGEFKAALAPYKDVKTATQHDVFAYLFRDIGAKEPHVIFTDPEVPLSPAELTATARDFKADGVKVIYTEPQYPEKMAKLLSSETGIPVVKLDPVVSGPEAPAPDYYEQQMRSNLKLMTESMGR